MGARAITKGDAGARPPALSLSKVLERLKAERRPRGPVPAALKELGIEWLAARVKGSEIARVLGVTAETVRLWKRQVEERARVAQEADSSGEAEPAVVADGPASVGEEVTPPEECPGSSPRRWGLSSVEQEEVLKYKRKNPSMGPAQIQTQLRRFKGWRLSVRAIGKVLKANGYSLVHTGSRPEGDEEPRRFEAPRPNALWQMDFVELRVGSERAPLLLVMDDFSRFVVGHAVLEEPTSEAVVGVLREAMGRHGKPEALYTDRGGPFMAWDKPSSMGRFLEDELVEHHVTPPYRPQGRGKVEALAHTVRRELWEVVCFASLSQAQEALRAFFARYNHRRAHMGLDGLTPADRYYGLWTTTRAAMEAACRRRDTLDALRDTAGRDYSAEPADVKGAADVLRLVVSGERLELRVFGYRVDLGELKI